MYANLSINSLAEERKNICMGEAGIIEFVVHEGNQVKRNTNSWQALNYWASF